MNKSNEIIKRETGKLFGSLFPNYDDRSFLSSMELFQKRFEANSFDLELFKNKICLDVGCGGGRYSIAASLLGAKKVYGIDIGEASIENACKRASNMNVKNTTFQLVSADEIPFDQDSIDVVIFSGVLQHTADPDKVISEISRVLRSGGFCYMLVYATGGVRWPMVQLLRPIADRIGFKVMDKAVEEAGLPVNKRRTYLDDLFVPVIDFYSWNRLESLLVHNGFKDIQRWHRGRFDHEENLETYLADLQGFLTLFEAGCQSTIKEFDVYKSCFEIEKNVCREVIHFTKKIISDVKENRISENDAMDFIVGQGHHRLIAYQS